MKKKTLNYKNFDDSSVGCMSVTHYSHFFEALTSETLNNDKAKQNKAKLCSLCSTRGYALFFTVIHIMKSL